MCRERGPWRSAGILFKGDRNLLPATFLKDTPQQSFFALWGAGTSGKAGLRAHSTDHIGVQNLAVFSKVKQEAQCEQWRSM